MHEFWYDYVKLKCGGTAQLCYMDSFISKADDVHRDIGGDVETRCWYFKSGILLPVTKI